VHFLLIKHTILQKTMYKHNMCKQMIYSINGLAQKKWEADTIPTDDIPT